MRRAAAVVLAALLLGGCVRLLPEARTADIYRLRPPAPESQTAPRPFGQPTVMISSPSAGRAFGASDILISRPDASLASVAGARWAGTARGMLQDYLIEMFEQAVDGPAPLRPGDGLAADYDLSLDLRNFEANYDQDMESAPLVRVAMGARLISGARVLVASSGFSSEVRARSNRMGDIIAAFDQATEEVASALVGWTGAAVAEAEARDRPPRS